MTAATTLDTVRHDIDRIHRSTTITRNTRRRGARALLAAALGAVVLTSFGPPASADPLPPDRDKGTVAPRGPDEPAPAGFATWDALWAAQARLGRAADTVAATAERAAGFAGIVADPQRGEVLLHWHGSVPADVEAALATARTTAPVRVAAAASSRAQLDAELDRWLASGQVFGGAPNVDGSGLELTVGPGRRVADLVRPLGAVAPVTVSDTGADTPLYDRSNDTPAYWGGGKIAMPGGSCTAGWPVRDRWGTPSMLTAAHCGNLGDAVYDGGGHNPNDYMGVVSERHSIRDSMLVWASAGLAPRVFLGDPTTADSLQTTGAQKVYNGFWVCTNGARTGRHCNIKVTKTAYSSTMTNGQQIKHMVVAEHQGGGCATAPGDSGGPVLSYGSTALAQGTITGGQGAANVWCGFGAYGHRTVIFPRITDVLLQFNATLMT